MLRELSFSELSFVSGGDGVGDIAGGVVEVIQDNLSWIGQTIENGFDGGETNVNNMINTTDANWINASNGWLYDTNSQMYGIDTDGDGYFNYAGNRNGCVFSMYDGLSWQNNYEQCTDENDPLKEFSSGIGFNNP